MIILNCLGICCIILIVIVITLVVKRQDNFADTTSVNQQIQDKIYPSYWYGYNSSDTRSKCFDCDRTSKYEHGTTCFDCEIPGGRQINPLLNRVLTR